MESLGTIIPRTNLSLGKVMHAALAEWLMRPEQNLKDLFLYAVTADMETMKEVYKRKVGGYPSDDELGDYYDAMWLGAAMCDNYQAKWQRPLFDNFALVQAEVELRVPIPHTEHTLSARLDAIIRDNGTGNLYILEHKTYKSRPRPDTLQMNDQFLAYTWAARTFFGNDRIMGVAYDGLWKRDKPPRGSTQDDLFTRLLITRPEHEIHEFELFLTGSATHMDDAIRSYKYKVETIFLYPNRRWEGCFDCGFEKLCAMQSRGEDHEHYKAMNYVKVSRDKEIEEAE